MSSRHADPGHDITPRNNAVTQQSLSHLTWLFSNALLHRPDVPARILLIARSADPWPAIRATLANHMAEHASTALAPLPDEQGGRELMFTTARDNFATRYEIDDPGPIVPPGPLTGPDMGPTLAVHMAALVAVDAAANKVVAPTDLAGLTAYLIDREERSWHRPRAHGTSSTSTSRSSPT